jgi:cysteine desulfurase
MQMPVYMDHHSTTPVDERVLAAMLPYFSEQFGNAASRTHPYGWRAAEAVEQARIQVSALMCAEPKEVIFTSGATESINTVVVGLARQFRGKKDHLVTCATEHPAVLDTCRFLEGEGVRVTYLPVDVNGMIDLDQLKDSLSSDTFLVSLMHANNEVGTVHPIAEIGRIAAERGVLFHVDAAQTPGRLPVNIREQNVDLLSLSAHKLYGPKGVGALVVKRRTPRTRLPALLHGGGHERGFRPGTLNVPGIVGLGAACEIAARDLSQEPARLACLRDRLLAGLQAQLDGVHVNGTLERRLPNNLNVSFAGVEGESLIVSLRDVVAVSSGSACSSAKVEPSHVLSAMGLSRELIHSSIRFGLGRSNTAEQVEYVAEHVAASVKRLRALGLGAQAIHE